MNYFKGWKMDLTYGNLIHIIAGAIAMIIHMGLIAPWAQTIMETRLGI